MLHKAHFSWQMRFAAKWTNEATPNLMGLLHKNVGKDKIYYSPHSLPAHGLQRGGDFALILCLAYRFCTAHTLGLLSGPTWRLKPGNFPIYRQPSKFHLLPSWLAHCHVVIDLFWNPGLWVASRWGPLSHSWILFQRCYKDKTNKQLSERSNNWRQLIASVITVAALLPLLRCCAEAARLRLNAIGLSWPTKAHLSLIQGFYQASLQPSCRNEVGVKKRSQLVQVLYGAVSAGCFHLLNSRLKSMRKEAICEKVHRGLHYECSTGWFKIYKRATWKSGPMVMLHTRLLINTFSKFSLEQVHSALSQQH